MLTELDVALQRSCDLTYNQGTNSTTGTAFIIHVTLSLQLFPEQTPPHHRGQGQERFMCSSKDYCCFYIIFL